eukprot:scaffold285725_cov29-Tisochrysis_lutea.AAC.3
MLEAPCRERQVRHRICCCLKGPMVRRPWECLPKVLSERAVPDTRSGKRVCAVDSIPILGPSTPQPMSQLPGGELADGSAH